MDKRTLIIAFSIGLLAIVMVILPYICFFSELDYADDPGDFGTFGDYVGGAFGALTGLISVAFLYVTYTKQMEMYKVQKEQIDVQQFDSNFFQLLQGFRSIVSTMQVTYDECLFRTKEFRGLEFMSKVRDQLSNQLEQLHKKKGENWFVELNSIRLRKDVHKIYQPIFEQYAAELGHYFRSLYHLLQYVDEKCPTSVSKKMYIDIVQSQMSTDELYLLCINGISNYGRQKLQPLLDHYSFLENLVIDTDPVANSLLYIFYPSTKPKNINGIKPNVILLNAGVGISDGNRMIRLHKDVPGVRYTSFELMLVRMNCSEVFDINKNKDKLITSIQTTIDPDYVYVISCPFCLLGKNGERDVVSPSILNELNVMAVITLTEEITVLHKFFEAQKVYDVDSNDVELYLENLFDNADTYTDNKDIPHIKIPANDYHKLVSELNSLLEGIQVMRSW